MSDNGDAVKRAESARNFSKQPRFDPTVSSTDLFVSLMSWARASVAEEVPDYKLVSKDRDEYLRRHVRANPNMSGVINSVVEIDKNRGWRMVGGRNQVARFTNLAHGFQAAPGLAGWRPGIGFSSRSYWESNMGFVVELGRDGMNGPIRELYAVDPVRCTLTGSMKYPLEYATAQKNIKKYWRPEDYFRGTSFVSNDESMHGLGYCALDRALMLSQLMLALYEHDFEAMGSRAPRGLMLLQGISEASWNKAMDAREARLDSKGYEYYGALAVLASSAKNVEAKLIALSELPKGFDMREFMDMLMYGIALCFGYDPSEFWPVQFGALGRGTEMEVQHEKATGKGRLDFPLTFQEQFQNFLPETLEFAFDQRDEKGDLLHASVNQAWINVVTSMSSSALISSEEARVLLADYGILPKSWVPDELAAQTDQDEKDLQEPVEGDLEKEPVPSKPEDMQARVKTSRLKLLKDDLKQRPHIWRCAEIFPAEPIVQYSWPGNTMIQLWGRADEILERSIWQGVTL